ncbi:GNAT family N-acetyltransferase [Roseibium polysiphoniae]|uniref:N-acetyltransferase n=1 Tax=Roseibium polysiphoniae TaxID=2571221 RepID=A0ABR9C807_9HYPH|nr:N-acetyltransferase [Roseibium polysiphoniae]MBD8876046.1 N-acetyltransferase [Roseibium polysiphoniae]
MKPSNWFIRLEEAADAADIENLQAEAFGPGRFARTAFKIREGIASDPRLSFVGMSGADLAGSVRLTPIMIGNSRGMLLGPLTVSPRFKNRGLGKELLRTCLSAAADAGETAVLLVGDAPYYGPLGFEPVPMGQIILPGPVDPARLLVACLNGSEMPSGLVRGGTD